MYPQQIITNKKKKKKTCPPTNRKIKNYYLSACPPIEKIKDARPIEK